MSKKEEVELVVKATDETGRTVEKLIKSIDELSASQVKSEGSSKSHQKAIDQLEQELKELGKALTGLNRQDDLIDQFKKQSDAAKVAGREWHSLKDGVTEYQKILQQSGPPTAAQLKQLKQLQKRADFAKRAFDSERKSLKHAAKALEEFGIAGRNAASIQQKIKVQVEKASTAFDRKRAALNKYNSELKEMRSDTKGTVPILARLRTELLAGASALAVTRGTINSYAGFERALIGVGKTANIEGKALRRFGDEVQKLSKRIPVSTQELLELSQAAGQLGIKGTENLLNFSRVMAELAEASDVSGESGARDIVRILGITDENIDQVDEFSNVLVGLGNNLAATEQEILDVATRVAQGTAAFKLSSKEILGISGGLKALGVQAELAGSSTQKAFIKMQSAIRDGGDELVFLEQITARTRQELEALFQNDQAALFEAFIEGLNRINDSGGDVITTLEQLGIKEVRTVAVLSTLAKGYNTFAKSLSTAEEEAQKNNARSVEAQKAFASLEKTMASVANATDRLGQEFGELISPEVERFINRATRKINSLGDAIERVNRLGKGEGTGGIQAQGPFEKLLTSLDLIDAVAFDVLFGKQIKAITGFSDATEDAATKSSDSLKKIAESQSNVLEPASAPESPPGTGASKKESQSLEASLKAQELIEQASIERRRRANEQALRAQKISIQEFYDERIKTEQDAIDLQIQAKQRELETSKEKAIVEAEIKLLVEQRNEVERQAIRERTEAEEQLAQKVAELRNDLIAAEGNETQARLNELGLQFAQKVQELVANGDEAGIELAQRLFNIESARIQFNALEDEFQQVMQDLRADQQSLQAEVEIGNVSQLAATTELNTLRDEARIKLQDLIDKMRELAEASDDPRLKVALKEMVQQVEGVDKKIDTTAKNINSRFASGFSRAFSDFVTGTKSAEDAFKQFAAEFLRYIAQMILQKAIFNALDKKETSNPGSSLGGIISGLISSVVLHKGGVVGQSGAPERLMPISEFINATRFHKGGTVGGLGPNERAAILETGEEVLTRNDPRNVLNRGRSVEQTPINLKVVNALDSGDLVEQGLATGAGERAILNMIRSNKEAVKMLLA